MDLTELCKTLPHVDIPMWSFGLGYAFYFAGQLWFSKTDKTQACSFEHWIKLKFVADKPDEKT